MSVLCAPEPPLSVLQSLVHSHWGPRRSALQALAEASPQFLQAEVSVDPDVLAFCLVNSASKWSLTSLKPSSDHGNSAAALTAGEDTLLQKCCLLCHIFSLSPLSR